MVFVSNLGPSKVKRVDEAFMLDKIQIQTMIICSLEAHLCLSDFPYKSYATSLQKSFSKK